jgi:branched-chain amino acid transport system substrate-binding protein
MRRILASLLVLLVVAGCGQREPLRIGFLGGLSGSVADLGEPGRNGAQIAVEEFNRAGGVNGRPVELIVRDDAQSPERAIAATNELIANRVEGIVGPMTSAMAEVVLPLAQQAGIVLISPTVTARKFFTQDDNLFLILSSTREEAWLSAEFHFRENGVRRVAAIHDLKNLAYTESWLREFTVAFQKFGGEVIPVAYESSPDANFASIVQTALSKQPDAVLMVASAVDAARFAQKIRERNRQILLFASQWAATERLVELGGQAVEGMVLHNYFDRDSQAPGLARLRELYIERFQREPGFSGVAAYDATRILLTALARRQNGEPLREALLTRGPFPGAEAEITFDRFGDNRRVPHVAVVRDGQFVTLR